MKGTEPPHIHVEKEDKEVKFWLDSVSISNNKGVNISDLQKIEKIIFEHQSYLLEKYDEFHGNK